MRANVENRPWGKFENLVKNKSCSVKILTIRSGKRFSLQFHKKREEHWIFLDNPAKVTLGKRKIKVNKGDKLIVKRKVPHRIEAINKDVNVLEISYGVFDEKDICRLEDDFGRV